MAWKLVLLCLALLSSASAAISPRPNILFLLADDQRADTIHALGNGHIKTPNLDFLAGRGVSFSQSYIMGSMQAAVCVPSRAMLMTGRTLFRALSSSNRVTIRPEASLWPELFRREGYQTFGIGKWHNDRASFNRAFSAGGPIFFGGMSDQSKIRVFDYDPSGAYPSNHYRVARRFSTELFAEAAVEFLRAPRQDPFVLYVAFTVPHDPRTPPAAFSKLYKRSKAPLPANFLPRHPFDNGEMKVRDEKLMRTPRPAKQVRSQLAAYYGLVTHLDNEIGRILCALKESGHEQNTIVVFASDNGLALGSHGLLGKQNLYEDSIRVPLIISGPGIRMNAVSDELCYLHDLAPTLCDLAAIPPSPGFEGLSLAPLYAETAPNFAAQFFALIVMSSALFVIAGGK